MREKKRKKTPFQKLLEAWDLYFYTVSDRSTQAERAAGGSCTPVERHPSPSAATGASPSSKRWTQGPVSPYVQSQLPHLIAERIQRNRARVHLRSQTYRVFSKKCQLQAAWALQLLHLKHLAAKRYSHRPICCGLNSHFILLPDRSPYIWRFSLKRFWISSTLPMFVIWKGTQIFSFANCVFRPYFYTMCPASTHFRSFTQITG